MKKIVLNRGLTYPFKLSANAQSLYEDLAGKKLTSSAATDSNQCEVLFRRGINRTDPFLVEVIERLGDEANGDGCELSIVECADVQDIKICSYACFEWIVSK